MTKTAHECFFIGREELASAMTAAFNGNRRLACALIGLFNWMDEMEPGNRMLCLDCDVEFSRDLPPDGVVVMMPMFEGDTLLITGVCPRCWTGDVAAMIVRHMRPTMPDIEIVSIGSA